MLLFSMQKRGQMRTGPDAPHTAHLCSPPESLHDPNIPLLQWHMLTVPMNGYVGPPCMHSEIFGLVAVHVLELSAFIHHRCFTFPSHACIW